MASLHLKLRFKTRITRQSWLPGSERQPTRQLQVIDARPRPLLQIEAQHPHQAVYMALRLAHVSYMSHFLRFRGRLSSRVKTIEALFDGKFGRHFTSVSDHLLFYTVCDRALKTWYRIKILHLNGWTSLAYYMDLSKLQFLQSKGRMYISPNLANLKILMKF